jgi:hypothetical protein
MKTTLILLLLAATIFSADVLYAQQTMPSDTSTNNRLLTQEPSAMSHPFGMAAMPNPSSQGGYVQQAMNGIYVEGGGSGLLYSINYERHLSSSVFLRVGFGTIGLSSNAFSVVNDNGSSSSFTFVMIPVTLSYLLFGDDRSHPSSNLELGVGATPIFVTYGSQSATVLALTGLFGYRFTPYDGGVIFRADLTPLLIAGKFILSGGLSLGYAF